MILFVQRLSGLGPAQDFRHARLCKAVNAEQRGMCSHAREKLRGLYLTYGALRYHLIKREGRGGCTYIVE